MSNNPKLDAAMRQSASRFHSNDPSSLHLVCIPAIMFAALGLLFALNFGVSLIAIAIAILYCGQYGRTVAAQMAGSLLVMLIIWMLFMPEHHLVAASLGIFLLAVAAQVFGQKRVNGGRPADFLKLALFAPIYVLVTLREKFIHRPGFDPR